MPLSATYEMLRSAQKNHYAVAAFNVENMEMVQAAIDAARECRAPVILQTTPSTLRYAPPELYHSIIAALAAQADIPAAVHLDHGEEAELAIRAMQAGYTSVMIDGSKRPLEENIELTRKVASAAKALDIPVEAELGKVGGKEDGLDGGEGAYTDPRTAAKFVESTGIASLAVAIGTAHGVYAQTPVLDIERLKAIRKLVGIPLVLHGASGLMDGQVRECIENGICKVNFATELRIAYSDGVKETLALKPGTFDPKAYGSAGRERVKQLCVEKIKLCGCDARIS